MHCLWQNKVVKFIWFTKYTCMKERTNSERNNNVFGWIVMPAEYGPNQTKLNEKSSETKLWYSIMISSIHESLSFVGKISCTEFSMCLSLTSCEYGIPWIYSLLWEMNDQFQSVVAVIFYSAMAKIENAYLLIYQINR